MPITVFDAIRGSIQSFLGGAEADLVPGDDTAAVESQGIREVVYIENNPYLFTARRCCIPFTKAEESFCRELLTAFAAMFSGFTLEGYAAHFRTAIRFEVKPGVINAILLDFDPNTAIVERGNGDYNLKPTGIRIVQTSDYLDSFGALTGTVAATFKDWSSATLAVVPQGGSTPIAAGRLFSNYTGGRWQAPFSAFVPGGTYMSRPAGSTTTRHP